MQRWKVAHGHVWSCQMLFQGPLNSICWCRTRGWLQERATKKERRSSFLSELQKSGLLDFPKLNVYIAVIFNVIALAALAFIVLEKFDEMEAEVKVQKVELMSKVDAVKSRNDFDARLTRLEGKVCK
jgi:CRISPR/Cas system-associated exonuclease Cas4 (RecB family)